jgi:DMSO reductase anchor subunit
MKPALSVIFFTVASGAGLGLIALVGLIDLAGVLGFGRPASLQHESMTRAALLGFAFTVAGLGASTLHLANPRNAWRSYARFRTSWLSREAVFAVAFLAVAAGYVGLIAIDVHGFVRVAAASAAVLLAWTVLVCTAMIYAGLKPIRQWHTRWTPAAYVVLGHWSGAVLLLGVARGGDSDEMSFTLIAAALGLAALAVKWAYWRAIDDPTDAITMEQAIGVDRGVRPPAAANGPTVMQARLLDTGHTHATFLTDEFGFALARRRRTALRALFWIAGIAVPLLWVRFGLPGAAGALTAGIACIVGLLAERWLFFAEARHTVRLYHGDPAT